VQSDFVQIDLHLLERFRLSRPDVSHNVLVGTNCEKVIQVIRRESAQPKASGLDFRHGFLAVRLPTRKAGMAPTRIIRGNPDSSRRGVGSCRLHFTKKLAGACRSTTPNIFQ
jgi:hypothetical protein